MKINMKRATELLNKLIKEETQNVVVRSQTIKNELTRIDEKYQYLSEADLNRITSQYVITGFAVISANRACNMLFGVEKCTSEQEIDAKKRNKVADRDLIKNLANSAWGYIPVWGGSKEKTKIGGKTVEQDTQEPEPAYLIPATKRDGQVDAEELKRFVAGLAKKYDQTSFLWKPPNKEDTNAYALTPELKVDMKFNGSLAINDLTQQYFTQLRQKNKGAFEKKPHSAVLSPAPKKRFSFTSRPSGVVRSLPEEQENYIAVPLPPRIEAELNARRGEIFIYTEAYKKHLNKLEGK